MSENGGEPIRRFVGGARCIDVTMKRGVFRLW
jgi:hypothetical protein